MKFVITMKDPDGFADSIDAAAKDSLARLAEAESGLSDDEADLLLDERRANLSRAASEWFRYSEYVDVEIDTEAKTATVLKVR